MERFQQILESPITALVVGLVFGAIALTGRLSVTLSQILLLLALVISCFSFRTLPLIVFLSLSFIAVGCFGLVGFYFRPELSKIDLSSNEGILVPGSDPNPAVPPGCEPPDQALAVIFGTNVAWNTNFPHTVIELGGMPMLIVDRNQDGSVKITTLRIFDDRDDMIARIDDEGFWVQNTIRRKRPDQSTLIVYDHNDEQVLKVKLLNKRFMSIEGVLRNKTTKPRYIVIDSANMKFMPMNITIAGNCSAMNKADISMN